MPIQKSKAGSALRKQAEKYANPEHFSIPTPYAHGIPVGTPGQGGEYHDSAPTQHGSVAPSPSEHPIKVK